MTAASSFGILRTRLKTLLENVRQLGLAVDDCPEEDEPAVVDALRTQVTQLEASVEEALHATGTASALSAARCQHAVNRASRALYGELASHDSIEEVLRAGSERGKAWEPWSGVVRDMLARCEDAFHQAADALAGCWEEIAERETHRAAQF